MIGLTVKTEIFSGMQHLPTVGGHDLILTAAEDGKVPFEELVSRIEKFKQEDYDQFLAVETRNDIVERKTGQNMRALESVVESA
jgi:hypothetical protein